MYKNGGYAGDDRMCDLVCDRYAVLQVMSRFGIALGFGDTFGSNAVGGLGVYSQTPEIVAEDYYAEDLRELNKYMKDIPQNLTENIQLPVMMQNGMQVSWTSSNAYYLSEQGIVQNIFRRAATVHSAV